MRVVCVCITKRVATYAGMSPQKGEEGETWHADEGREAHGGQGRSWLDVEAAGGERPSRRLCAVRLRTVSPSEPAMMCHLLGYVVPKELLCVLHLVAGSATKDGA